MKSLFILLLTASPLLAHEAREVTASSLNVRSGPGTGYSIVGVAASGQRYVVVQISPGWVKIGWNGGYGWMSAPYTTVVTATEIEVTTSTLNVRSSPSTSASIVGAAHSGEIYVGIELSGGWRQIWFGGAARWVYSAYTKIHSDASVRYAPTASELDLFERTVTAEAGGESYDGQVAVAAVILNRIASADFPNTMSGVIYQQGQFEAVSSGYVWQVTPAASVKSACQAALRWSDPSFGALYYFNYTQVWPSWADTRTYTVTIGAHRFYK